MSSGRGSERVAVVGAGIAGLVAAVELAARGVEVEVFERADAPGGKLRQQRVGGARVDAGPTVLTLREVFESVFDAAGSSLDRHLALRPAAVLARHAWSETERLDLFPELERSADAIGALAGPAEAAGYRRFCARARDVYRTLEEPFLHARRPGPLGLARAVGLRRLGELWRIRPFSTLWGALGDYFRDPRLRQLFGRYATYVGSSPFAAPATLMLIAHVEREGVWLVEGGMQRIAAALTSCAEGLGARVRCGAEVREIATDGTGVAGLVLADGERIAARRVVVNADAAALAAGRLGPGVAAAVPPLHPAQRSLSAITWTLVARAEGFPLHRHSVFFSRDYAAEFEDLFGRRRLPREPTVYVCAQDRGEREPDARASPERLLCLVNAPATGDSPRLPPSEIERCETRAFALLERCGLRLRPEARAVTTPADFEGLFPGTGGALYGRATHGWRASFQRPGPRTAIPRLYLAGGSAHPGAGVPMAAISGRLAAAALMEELASTRSSLPTATSGGTWTRSATTGARGSR